MVDQEAIDLIKNALKKGKSKNQLMKNLKKAGYSKEEAEKVFKQAKDQMKSKPSKKEKEPEMELEEALKEEEETTSEEESGGWEETPVKEETSTEPEPQPSKKPEPKAEKTVPAPSTNTRKPRSKSRGNDPITKTLNYFRDFWTKPVNLMKNAAKEKEFVLPVIMIGLAFVLTWGQIAATTAKAEGSPSAAITSKMIYGITQGLAINPANVLAGVSISGVGYQLMWAFVITILSFLAIVFTSTMVLRALGEAKKGLVEVLMDNFKFLSVPYSLVVVYSALFSIISLGLVPIESEVMLILMIIVSFFPVFFSVYAYVLYAEVLKEKYDMSLAKAAGISVILLVVTVLFVKVAMMSSGIGMAVSALSKATSTMASMLIFV